MLSIDFDQDFDPIDFYIDTVPDLDRRPFRTSGVPKGARPLESYKKATQISRFTEVFGENQQYFNQTSFLMKGQLTPESDFIFSSHQLASYFFINVAPQFNAVSLTVYD